MSVLQVLSSNYKITSVLTNLMTRNAQVIPHAVVIEEVTVTNDIPKHYSREIFRKVATFPYMFGNTVQEIIIIMSLGRD